MSLYDKNEIMTSAFTHYELLLMLSMLAFVLFGFLLCLS